MEFNREFNATFNELVENEMVGLGKSLDEKNAYSNLQHVVRIKFNFGKGDLDGDGVPDKKDHCPDLPGLIELNGINDGVPSPIDKVKRP